MTGIKLRAVRHGRVTPHPFKNEHTFTFEKRGDSWHVLAVEYAPGWWNHATPLPHDLRDGAPVTPRQHVNTDPWISLAEHTLWCYLARVKHLETGEPLPNPHPLPPVNAATNSTNFTYTLAS